MDNANDWQKPENILRSFLQLGLLPAIGAIVGANWKDFGGFLETVATTISPKLFLSTVLLILLGLAAIASYLGYLLLTTRRENRRLAQKAHFYTIFGAKWKYWPASKQYEQFPHCRCCTEPNPCQIWRSSSGQPETLSCPSHQNPRVDFGLHDPNDPERNYLTIAEALRRISKMEAPHAT